MEAYHVPQAEEVYELIQKMTSVSRNLSDKEENPDRLLADIDKCLENIEKLVQKCDEIEGSSFSDDEINNLIEEIE